MKYETDEREIDSTAAMNEIRKAMSKVAQSPAESFNLYIEVESNDE